MPSPPKRKRVLPNWAKELPPEEQAKIEAIDWDARSFLDDDETVVISDPRSAGGCARKNGD